MYGMIHQAARDLVLAKLGRAEWEALLARSGLADRHFIGVGRNSDTETLILVGLIAERLDVGLDDALHAFGRFWIDFAEGSAYGHALSMVGGDLETFIRDIDRMHASIESTLPGARPPSFEIRRRGADAIDVRYRSRRPGLSPFLHGILCAVAERFGERVEITYAERPDGALFSIVRTDNAD